MYKLLIAIISLLPITVFALSYETEFPYSDPPQDIKTRIAVGTLTKKGILRGYSDGTFRDGNLLNRAEFMQITMALIPYSDTKDFDKNCFPDVSSDKWFAVPVCYAKYLGIINGNEIKGVDSNLWVFEPSRSVQYEEAIKVLINIYKINPIIPNTCAKDSICELPWYTPYLLAADELNVSLPLLLPGHKLTRGEMSQLVVNFLAYSAGELDFLRKIELKGISSKKHNNKNICSPIVCNDGRTFESCDQNGEQLLFKKGTPCFNENNIVKPIAQKADSGSSTIYDQNTDLTTDSKFLLLGNTSPVLGSIEVFNDSEPFDVTKITIVFSSTSSLNSVQAVHVYDEGGVYLGRANKDSSVGNRHFVLNLKSKSWTLKKRESRYIYVRAQLSKDQQGGVSGEEIKVDNIQVEGIGLWSNRNYSQNTDDDFNSFQTGRSEVIGITNGGTAKDLLTAGTNLLIGEFRFDGKSVGGTADLKITDVIFTIGTNDDVTISNMQLGSADSTDRINCIVTGNKGTCSSIPDYIGSFKKAPRIIQVFADVVIPTNAIRPSLQLSINNPGNTGEVGDITWSDGTTSFTWVPYGTPVVRGTYFSW